VVWPLPRQKRERRSRADSGPLQQAHVPAEDAGEPATSIVAAAAGTRGGAGGAPPAGHLDRRCRPVSGLCDAPPSRCGGYWRPRNSLAAAAFGSSPARTMGEAMVSRPARSNYERTRCPRSSTTQVGTLPHVGDQCAMSASTNLSTRMLLTTFLPDSSMTWITNGRFSPLFVTGSRSSRTLDVHVDGVNRRAGTHVQTIAKWAAESEVRAGLRQMDFADQLPGGGVAADSILLWVGPSQPRACGGERATTLGMCVLKAIDDERASLVRWTAVESPHEEVRVRTLRQIMIFRAPNIAKFILYFTVTISIAINNCGPIGPGHRRSIC
jgi:hypothetical protein